MSIELAPQRMPSGKAVLVPGGSFGIIAAIVSCLAADPAGGALTRRKSEAEAEKAARDAAGSGVRSHTFRIGLTVDGGYVACGLR